jgi:hypothetical protein
MEKDIEELICKMYEARDENGRPIPVQDIRLETGVNPADIYMVLRRNKIPLRRDDPLKGRATKLSRLYSGEVLELVRNLFIGPPRRTAMYVSQITGIPYYHVRRILHGELGGEPVETPKGRPLRGGASTQEVMQRIDGGMSIEMAAADLGVSSAEVVRALGVINSGGGVSSIVNEATVANLTSEVLKKVVELVKNGALKDLDLDLDQE